MSSGARSALSAAATAALRFAFSAAASVARGPVVSTAKDATTRSGAAFTSPCPVTAMVCRGSAVFSCDHAA